MTENVTLPNPPPPRPPPPDQAAPATVQQATASRGGGGGAGTGGRSHTYNTRGGGGGGGGGGGSGGRHTQSSFSSSRGGRGGGGGGRVGGSRDQGSGVAGGREARGGRQIYNPQHPQQHQQQHQQQPRLVQQQQPTAIHQQTGLPHGHVPAYLPGSASLVEELDSQMLVVMRDGRHLVGTLCSYDQFSNLVLKETVERRFVHNTKDNVLYFSDIPLGLYVVRGESVVVMGQTTNNNNIMDNNNTRPPPPGIQVDLAELEIKRKEAQEQQVLDWDVDTDLVA